MYWANFFGGKIFLEILNDAVQRFFHAVNWKNVLPNLKVWEKNMLNFISQIAQKRCGKI